jgi:GTP cyclohydrolase I
MHSVDLEHVEETFDITPPPDGIQAEAHKAHIQNAVREILAHIGEDPDRDGLRSTPDRVARMYDELTIGYHTDPIKLVNNALFDVDYDEMVIVKDGVAFPSRFDCELA